MYVSMYVCMHVCMDVHESTIKVNYMHVTQISVCVFVPVHEYVCMHACLSLACMGVCKCMFACVCVDILAYGDWT